MHTQTTPYSAAGSRIGGWNMQDDALRKAIGSRIKALRKDKKLSQKELAGLRSAPATNCSISTERAGHTAGRDARQTRRRARHQRRLPAHRQSAG